MKKSEILVGATYLMMHSSGLVKVTIRREIKRRSWAPYGGRDMTHWVALNLKTGREIEIKSAAKLRTPAG